MQRVSLLMALLVLHLSWSRALRDDFLATASDRVKNTAGDVLVSVTWGDKQCNFLMSRQRTRTSSVYRRLQVARDMPGWDEFESEHFQWVTYRAPSLWRGVGVGIALDKFDCVIQKLATTRGMWVLARIHGLGRVVCGALHAHTGATNAIYQAAVHEFFAALPRKWRQYPLLCGVDANETPGWNVDENGSAEICQGSVNLNVLIQDALNLGCVFQAPRPEQFCAPTHFPRDSNRRGRQIDVLLRRQIWMGPTHIDAERRHCIETDHAYLFSDIFLAKKVPKLRWGNDSRARWVVAELPALTIVDAEDVQQLAKECTRPLPSSAYRDDPATKDAFRVAKNSSFVGDWKKAHKLRRKARSQWKRERLERILQGSWEEFRQLQNEKKKKRGWWGGMLLDKSAAQLTGEVQAHLEKKMVDPKMHQWDEHLDQIVADVGLEGEFVAFSILDLREELQYMKCKSAVGPDGIGVHLLRTMASHDELGPQLLALINQIVREQEIPNAWSKSFLALLAKVPEPGKPGDLRPISVSSAFNKLVNRMVCARALPLMRRGSRVSSCGKGRQAADIIGTMSRIRDVVREWKFPALVCKLDVAGAFDRVDRGKVAELLVQRLRGRGVCHELRYLLCQLRTHELYGKVPGGHTLVIAPNNGIKQGAPESAEIFGLVMDAMLGELTNSKQWKALGEALPKLDVDLMFYQDDVFVLEKELGMLGRRVRVINKCLQRAGLKLATEKTKIVASAPYRGARKIKIGEDVFEIASAAETVKVLGVSFSFQNSPSFQAQELLSRTRAAAAAHKDLLSAKGTWERKLHIMKMLVESCFTWTAGALHWSSEDLRCANLLQLHTLRRAFNLRRQSGESWVDWNSRTMRYLRAWLAANGHPRWSEKILGLQFNLHGHWARRIEHDWERDVISAALPMRALLWKSTFWWREQQALSHNVGARHPCRFYASNPERQLCEAINNLWHVEAQDRDKWALNRNKYIEMWDVKWSSGRQLALRF